MKGVKHGDFRAGLSRKSRVLGAWDASVIEEGMGRKMECREK